MGEKADSDLVRRQNRRIVLEALRQHRALARVELGRVTGLSPASITAISAQLIEENIIQEFDVPLGAIPIIKRGRPIVRLVLKPEATRVIAVKVSIDDVVIALADFQGETIARRELRIPTYETGQSEFGKLIADEIAVFLERENHLPSQIARIGVAVQGLADMRDGSIVWSPAFAARNIPVSAAIEARLAVPCMVANDANMIAEGLLSLDRKHYGGVTAAIYTGYGVGMGLIIDGKVYHGATGAASEFGHMNHLPGGALCRCGKRGCIEAYAADYGILRLAMGDTQSTAPYTAVETETMTSLMDRAATGDAAAADAFAAAGTALGFGIARLIAILNPDRIVLAGPGMQASALVEPAMRRALEDGIVEDLRRHVVIEHVSFSNEMIIRGTIDSLLRTVDRDVFSAGPLARAAQAIEMAK